MRWLVRPETSAIVLVLMACSPGGEQAEAGNADRTVLVRTTEDGIPLFDRAGFVGEPDGLTELWAVGMTCLPEDARVGDILRIKFHVPHGAEMDVISPSGKWFSYAYPDESDSPPLDGNVVQKVDQLGINLRTAQGRINYRMEPIFREDGIYRIVVSSNMGVDREDLMLDAYCHFNFRSKT